MTGAEAAAAYAGAYVPQAEDLRRSLPEMAEGLHAQLIELYTRPTASSAETLAANLEGARRLCLRFAQAVRTECEIPRRCV